MTDDSPQPLWRASVGETEPWRRGRLALILMGAITLASHITALLQNIFSGNVEQFLAIAVGCALFWLRLQFWYRFPFSLASFGPMAAQGKGISNHVVQIEARLVDNGSGWQIDTIEWFYPGTLGSPG